MKNTAHLFWFRRDLRLRDNAGLYHALRSGVPVVPVFIFDRNILDRLDGKTDTRVAFIYTRSCNACSWEWAARWRYFTVAPKRPSGTGETGTMCKPCLWRNNEADFQRWCEGRTGYPLVDAARKRCLDEYTRAVKSVAS